MKFYSTNNRQLKVSLREAVINGLASDNGLYMPEEIISLSPDSIKSLATRTFPEIALLVAQHLIGNDVDGKNLERIVHHTIGFDAPLVEVEENIYGLELFHGPTMAFKDFGARFMSQLLGHFVSNANRKVTVLVATSGDTGSAVANGFYEVEGIDVIILYPSGKVSPLQEKQFTTLGKNITALEIDGTFDDCQRLVKAAFLDKDLQASLFLTSANSINIARLIPQSFYYFYAWSRLARREKVVFSVPSGNFGNLTAGLLAQRLGLPIHHFIASTNANEVVPKYLRTKIFEPIESFSTISNAMDVGNPSNFSRMAHLFDNDWNQMKRMVSGYSFSDDATRNEMRAVYEKSNYILDPHGAVGLLGLREYQTKSTGSTGVFLETAHPAKFKNVVESTLGISIPIPKQLQYFEFRQKVSEPLGKGFKTFKERLLAAST